MGKWKSSVFLEYVVYKNNFFTILWATRQELNMATLDESQSIKIALLRMRGEAESEIKSADLSLKKATRNHRTEVSAINKKITDIDRNIKRCDKGQSPKKMSIPIVRKRGRGRPKGSLNKVKRPKEVKVKRGRGRPKGSLNKVKRPKEIKVKRGRGRPKGSITKEVKNSKTLNAIVLEILKNSKRGLTLTKIVLKVVKIYNTKDDLSKLVYVSLNKLQQLKKVVKDENKMYRVKK